MGRGAVAFVALYACACADPTQGEPTSGPAVGLSALEAALSGVTQGGVTAKPRPRKPAATSGEIGSERSGMAAPRAGGEAPSDGPGMAAGGGGEYLVAEQVEPKKPPIVVKKSGALGTSVLLVGLYKDGSAPSLATLLKKPADAKVASKKGRAKALVMGASTLLPQESDFKSPRGAYKILYKVPKGTVPGRPPWIGAPGGLGLHASETGGVGITGTAGAGRAYWGSLLYVWDSCGKGHSALAFSTGGGGLGGVSLSGGAVFEWTNAQCISDLAGWSDNIGGSSCIGPGCVGVTAIIGKGYSGVDVFAGAGIGLFRMQNPTVAQQLIGNFGFSGGSTYTFLLPFTNGTSAVATVYPTAYGLALPTNPVNFWGTPGVPIYNGPAGSSGPMQLPGFGPPVGPTMEIPGLQPVSGPTMYIPGFEPPTGPTMWIPGLTP